MDESKYKILIVDDERLNINVLHDLLKPYYKTMAAISGKQALKAAESAAPPDLILLDIMMPEMDGYEVCQRLKENKNTCDIPVMFVTAMGESTDETRGFEVGAADYLTKPISAPKVLARVKTQLELKQQRDDLKAAYQTIEAHKDRMQEELNVGRDIQMSMVPQLFPPFPERNEFSLHAALIPAREVGGDFYDYFFIDENRICVCVGDVSGKGVPAALFMAVTRTLMKARATEDISTASIVTRVNDELSSDNKKSMFVTVFIAVFDVVTGKLTFTNGGHNPPVVRKADGELLQLTQRHGPVLGAMSGLTYKEDSIQLMKGDLLFVYTDGVTEARNSEKKFFGDDYMLEVLNQTRGFDTQETTEHFITEIKRFEDTADQFDDITVLALQYAVAPDTDSLHKVEMSITNDLKEIESVKDRFKEFAEEVNLETSIRRKLSLVFDELVNNVISYAYEDDDQHTILLTFVKAGDRLIVTIEDDGMPFNPFEAPAPDTSSEIDDRPIGGLGIHLVRTLMDKASYNRKVDRNVVTLIKNLTVDTKES
ncbi:SpoIIE family protein phosphatase [Desulforhopalus sp. 52FAK]